MFEPAFVQGQIFSGHESFPIRFTWLTKAVRHCEPEKDRDLFSRPDAMVTLGVGKNMVRSMRSWGISTRMLEKEEQSRAARLRPTTLGALLFGTNGLDPFMEDPATIWILHWSLASNRHIATWFWTFNELRKRSLNEANSLKVYFRLAVNRPVEASQKKLSGEMLIVFFELMSPRTPISGCHAKSF